MSKFYKTRIVLDILTDEPIPAGMDLQTIIWNCDSGDWVKHQIEEKTEELTGQQIVKELEKAGSDANFFHLNKDGTEIED